MDGGGNHTPGVSIEVEDLIGVRRQLFGLFQSLARRRASLRSGPREFPVRGRGMEYEESRAYVSGDDFRTMDWRIMARTGEAHTKIFAEEKERRFLIAVDLSASMFFGTRLGFKSWAAAQVAAHAGWFASFAGDRIGGLIAMPESHHEIRPRKTRSGLLGVFHHLSLANHIRLPPEPTPDRLNFLLRELNRVAKPGSIIALISDFIGVDRQSSQILSSLVRHNDINAYWIHDDTEISPWPRGHYAVLQDRQIVDFDLLGTGADSWLGDRQQQHREQVEKLTSQFNIPLMPISCNREITPQFTRQLAL